MSILTCLLWPIVRGGSVGGGGVGRNCGGGAIMSGVHQEERELRFFIYLLVGLLDDREERDEERSRDDDLLFCLDLCDRRYGSLALVGWSFSRFSGL